MRNRLQYGVLALAIMVAAPAWADDAQPKNPDPWEHFNRKIFRFNDAADRYAVKPAAKAYIRVTPDVVRTGIGNFFDNLNYPLTVVNQALQGKFKLAAQDTGRFLVNSTVGVLGLFDVATKFSLPAHKEDFGQTLGVWGVGPGPYLMLPFAGPSTVRDLGGQGVDVFLNPKNYYFKTKASFELYVAEAFNHRAELIPVEGIIQGDRYIFIRDLYLQKREYDIKDGKVEDQFLNDEDSDNSSGGDQGAATPAAQTQPAPAGSEPVKAAPDHGSDPFLDSPSSEQPATQPSPQPTPQPSPQPAASAAPDGQGQGLQSAPAPTQAPAEPAVEPAGKDGKPTP